MLIITPETKVFMTEFQETPLSLQTMQNAVNGYIEMIGLGDKILSSGRDIVMVLDEEGKIKGLPLNVYGTAAAREFAHLDDLIVGRVAFAAVNEEGETLALSDDEQAELLRALHGVLCSRADSPAFTNEAYRRYQLWWMAEHGCSVASLIQSMALFAHDCTEDSDDSDIITIFRDWQDCCGFDGALWACKEEFLDAEYQDTHLMYDILPKDMWCILCAARSGRPMMRTR